MILKCIQEIMKENLLRLKDLSNLKEQNLQVYVYTLLKNVYIDKSSDRVNKYSNVYHGTIKMKPVDVKLSAYIDFNKEHD